MSFAIQASKANMIEVAQYFEEKGVHDKAVQLYQKGGNTAKALELCFSAQLFDVLRTIADDLDGESSPAMFSLRGVTPVASTTDSCPAATSLFVAATARAVSRSARARTRVSLRRRVRGEPWHRMASRHCVRRQQSLARTP